MNYNQLEELAKEVLHKNWVKVGKSGGFTKPAAGIYPFQWNWDSALIAYGYACYDTNKAIEELRALFAGQWSNGMVPHIVFHNFDSEEQKSYFPGPDMWNCNNVQSSAPTHVLTSGMTQPPVAAMAVWRIYKTLLGTNPTLATEILKEFYPKLLAYHRYLHTARDPEQSGLVTIYHPWESGFDNSPRWDEALERIKPIDMSQYKRKDTEHVNRKNRPSDKEYGRYLQVLFYLREHCYNDATLYENAPF